MVWSIRFGDVEDERKLVPTAVFLLPADSFVSFILKKPYVFAVKFDNIDFIS